MATYYLRTDGNDGNAGTSDTSGGAWRTLEYAGSQVAAGDVVYIRGTAGNASSWPTSSLDYTIATRFTPSAGSSTSGEIRWLANPAGPMPTISAPGNGIYNLNYHQFSGLYFVALGTTNGNVGILHGNGVLKVTGCRINQNNQNGCAGISSNGIRGCIIGNVIWGGTSSPSIASNSQGITGSGVDLVVGNRIFNCRNVGINVSNGSGIIRDNLVYGCASTGINTINNGYGGIIGNTVDNNLGHGISTFASTNYVRFNSVTNHTQSGTYGINCTDTINGDLVKMGWEYNNVWNNTTNYNNISADPTDLSVDPQYADAANGDYTPTNVALKQVIYFLL